MNISAKDLKANNTLYSYISEEDRAKNDRKTVYAMDLKVLTEPDTGETKAQAQKKALKEILDQYAKDAKTDGVLTGMEDHQKQMDEEAMKALEEAKRLETAKAELTKQGETDPEVLKEYDQAIAASQQKLQEANQAKVADGKAMSGMKVEMVKNQGMLDAKDNAEKIMENAAKEAAGILLAEGKDKVDEEAEKSQEKIEQAEDQKQEVTPEIEQQEMLDEINKVIKKDNILPEDVKGLVVDDQM